MIHRRDGNGANATAACAAGDAPIRIGISSCLLGNAVRFDAGHKRNAFLVETLGRYVEWVTVCPEIEIGLGIPRPTLRLESGRDGVRLVMPKTGADYTDAMHAYADMRVARLGADELCGYVLKKDSPSCGMEGVQVYGEGIPSHRGRGVFAQALLRRFPCLPVEEEGRLDDPTRRENFIERVFAYRRLRALFSRRWARRDLVAFHTAHKLQLMAHAPKWYAALGRVVADATSQRRAVVHTAYETGFMAALSVLATRRRHTNVLQHMVGYFTRDLDDSSRRALLAAIEHYRTALVPLVVPRTLIRHYAHHFDVTYLKGQVYLEPHPKELMLRNHV